MSMILAHLKIGLMFHLHQNVVSAVTWVDM